MIASIIPIVVLSAVAVSANYHGVDPNTLQCDPDGQIFLLLPHFTDCDKFYMCTHGREVEFSCAPGTIFDFENQLCNWPHATKCILREEPQEPEPEAESEESEEESDASGDSETEGETEGSGEGDFEGSGEGETWYDPEITARSFASSLLDCRHPSSASKQLAYHGDCQRYWRCVAGMLQTVTCSEGLFFNDRTEQCDFEANVRCLEQTDELENEFIVYK